MKKRYYNSETKEWYTEGNSITRQLSNGVLFTGIPSEEQLYDWGYREWIEPAPTPQQLLEKAKQEKIASLMAYDASSAVNGFDVTLNDTTMSDLWITPEQRANYKNSLDSAELLGMDKVHPVLNGVTLELSVSNAKVYLAQIQIYADRCYGVTETHKANINALNSVDDVEAYDFETNYPQRLVFII